MFRIPLPAMNVIPVWFPGMGPEVLFRAISGFTLVAGK